MKNLSLFIILSFVTGCSVSDDSFIDFFSATTVLPPASFELASAYKSHAIIASLNSNGRIYGTGNGKRFYTDDFFQTIQIEEGYASPNLFDIDGHFVHQTVYNDNANTLTIFKSSDFAKTFPVSIVIPNVFDNKFIYHAESGNIGWVLLQRGFMTEVIRIIGDAYETLAILDTREDLVSIWVEGNDGVIAIEDDYIDDKLTIFRSYDGGFSWVANSSISLSRDNGNTPYSITHIRAHGDMMYAYSDAAPTNLFTSSSSQYMYVSRDNGVTWSFFNDNKLRAFQFLTSTDGFAIKTINYTYNWEDDELASTGYLYKTTDGGITWQQVGDQLLYADRIFFLDENIGLAMSYSVLQLTTDGGKNWNLLIYPIGNE